MAGKVVVVTGGGHGIGQAYCERLAAEGASVVVADLDGASARQVAAAIVADGGDALGVQVDVASFPSVQALAAQVVERYGGLDGLVNNAAVFATIPISRVGFEEIDETEWDLVMSVNVKGVWNCCRALAPALRARGGGSIVNICSASILHAGGGRMHYVASKAAVFGISRTLARELGGDNIRVNSLAPGNTLSEVDPTPEIVAMREAAIAARSLKRLQRPADMVGTVVFLLSDDSAFMTGQLLVVDGGSTFH
ncbi:MAG: SDR family oxidoreductase [Chloroflexi bacterium]|nr:SDR family oxidoreductase [Chloroflexota bacterium]